MRETEEEAEVVPNLMIGFGIDEVQAEYVAEIKLRHLNREYILKRTEEIGQLEKDIAELQEILDSKRKGQGRSSSSELQEVAKQVRPAAPHACCSMPTRLEEVPGRGGDPGLSGAPVLHQRRATFKKITPQSLRMSGEQKLKEGDEVVQQVESTNNCRPAVLYRPVRRCTRQRPPTLRIPRPAYWANTSPRSLGMDEGENAVYMAVTKGLQRLHAVLL